MVTLSDMQGKVLEFIFRHIRDTGAPPTLREIASHFEWKAVGSAQDVVAALRKKGLLAQSEAGKSRQLIPTDLATQHIEGFSLSKKNPSAPTSSAVSAVRATKRNLHSTHTTQGIMHVPVLGLVQAGNPIEGIESASKHIPFPYKETKTEKNLFALSIDGYSMLNAGFLPGDYVLVEAMNDARNGDIIVASLGSQVTVKRFALKGSHLYKQSVENLRNNSTDSAQSATSQLPPAMLIPENPDFDPMPFGLNEDDRVVGVVRALYRAEIN